MRILLFTGFFLLALSGNTFATKAIDADGSFLSLNRFIQQDTSKTDTSKVGDSLLKDIDRLHKRLLPRSVLKKPAELALYPASSLQQSLKGQAPGLFVQEPSGEPGTVQQMYIHGSGSPLLSKRDVYQNQPLIVLDDIPLISEEHPFAFDIQQFDFNRIGTATNLLAEIDMNNIESVEVLKDAASIAYYGPRGANGVIRLTSKQAGIKRRISFNSYVGIAARPQVTTINGAYENNFRKQFYDRYTPNGQYNSDDVYPLYLSDSLNTSYYGPSNWTDSYYRNALVYGVQADLSGGSDRANFRFSAGNVKSDGVADNTGLDKYNAFFNVNIKPLTWLTFSAMVNGTRLKRDRNRNLRDRFAQMAYIPDLGSPLAPNNTSYSTYLTEFDKGFDDNFNNLVQAHGILTFNLGEFKLISKLAMDYNEGFRDLFYARGLMEGNSYASNYYGFNQRLIQDNRLSFHHRFNEDHLLNLEVGQSVQKDTYKYNYGYAYKGVNDFIKLNLLETDPNNSNYLNPLAFPKPLVYKFLDRTRQNLVSYFAKADYSYKDKYSISVILREDASSNAQPTNRWLFTPTVSTSWDIKKDLMQDNSLFSDLNFRISAGRVGKLNSFDNFAQGPQYTADAGFTGNVTAPGFNAFAVLTRPYTFGWVGYGIPWAYTDQLNTGLDFSFLKSRLRGSIDAYTRSDKNQLLGIPAFAEYGYSQAYEAGMSVSNMGLDFLVSADILKSAGKGLSWTTGLNFNINKNKLTGLPGQRDQLIIGNRLLKVGQPIDGYWLLSNEGIYSADTEVPQRDGKPMTYNGIVLRAGDPKWKDLNNDNRIDNNDKTLMGHSLPAVSGSFSNQFAYKNWSLGVDLYFNLGRKVINQEMADRFNFINREGTIAMTSVKEITYWEKRGDYSKYPLYNPWSTVIPYRSDQDLFLENASFVKIRSVSLGYDLSGLMKKKKIERFYVYASANNLLTITKYTGQDPELTDYTGYDTGYGMVIPKTYTIGIRMDL
jgi:TonB-linked SusC/RagA family outer membrane protein